MTPRRLLLPLVAALALAAVPAALAVEKFLIGDSNGTPVLWECPAQLQCTYLNTHDGAPADVVPADGTLTSWKVRAGNVGGKVRLRVLRPVGDGAFKFVESSDVHTITRADPEANKFSSRLPVRAGDVLALTDHSGGVYFRLTSERRGVAYFQFQDQSDGVTGTPGRTRSALHLLLSATVTAGAPATGR